MYAKNSQRLPNYHHPRSVSAAVPTAQKLPLSSNEGTRISEMNAECGQQAPQMLRVKNSAASTPATSATCATHDNQTGLQWGNRTTRKFIARWLSMLWRSFHRNQCCSRLVFFYLVLTVTYVHSSPIATHQSGHSANSTANTKNVMWIEPCTSLGDLVSELPNNYTAAEILATLVFNALLASIHLGSVKAAYNRSAPTVADYNVISSASSFTWLPTFSYSSEIMDEMNMTEHLLNMYGHLQRYHYALEMFQNGTAETSGDHDGDEHASSIVTDVQITRNYLKHTLCELKSVILMISDDPWQTGSFTTPAQFTANDRTAKFHRHLIILRDYERTLENVRSALNHLSSSPWTYVKS